MKVCIMGTCRVCLTDILPKKKKRFYLKKYINYHIVGHHSKVYIYMNKNNKKVRIHTQPITYTTKLADVMNCLEYLQGKNYNIDPNTDINFFNIFFRGIKKRAFNKKLLIKPNQKIEGDNNNYNMYIFEICSIREIIFDTDKYGEEHKNKI